MNNKVVDYNLPAQYRASSVMIGVTKADNDIQQANVDYILGTLLKNTSIFTADTSYIFLLALRQFGIIRPVLAGGLKRWDSSTWDSPFVSYDIITTVDDIGIDDFKKVCRIIMDKTYPVFNVHYLFWLCSYYTDQDPATITITTIILDFKFMYNIIMLDTPRSRQLKGLFDNFSTNENFNIFNIPMNTLVNIQLVRKDIETTIYLALYLDYGRKTYYYDDGITRYDSYAEWDENLGQTPSNIGATTSMCGLAVCGLARCGSIL